MIFIDDSLANIKDAKKQHCNVVSNYLKVYQINKKNGFIIDFLKSNLNDLVTSKPDKLFQLNKKLYQNKEGLSFETYKKFCCQQERKLLKQVTIDKYKAFNKEVLDIINYENWFITSQKQYDYQLAEGLNRRTCTYCNRIYTSTMKTQKNKKLMRPQFDHWYPKSKFPLLALSFYNLIPSCSICNSSAKSDVLFDLETHLHPYVDKDSLKRFSFSYEYSKSLDQYNIKLYPTKQDSKDKKAVRTFDDFNLSIMYNANVPELKDLIQTKKAYTKSYIDNMMSAYPDAHLSYKETYRLAFGTEYNEEDFHKRPFSKFKKDILQQLKVIK
ncbi:hypothetical protein J8L88_05775 [Aquimarina sp. MMG015]|uniref:hypothetical protein n=1 Tax=Aquimarina sp. MMG015 TaxID=2822689 RepID=UPI001B3A22D6|nr:hypothetical protein [Aquimarina sp. MMG015]MBQ4802359.1 hypothetical protein [Aquimarina sp. MMG015]